MKQLIRAARRFMRIPNTSRRDAIKLARIYISQTTGGNGKGN